jgi:hypothetical protein
MTEFAAGEWKMTNEAKKQVQEPEPIEAWIKGLPLEKLEFIDLAMSRSVT